MNPEAEKEYSTLTAFVPPESISKPTFDSIRMNISGTDLKFDLTFTIPAKYPETPLNIDVQLDPSYRDKSKSKSILDYLNKKNQELVGFNSIIPLYFEAKNVASSCSNLVSNKQAITFNSAPRKTPLLINSVTETEVPKNINVPLLVYLFHTAITRQSDDSEKDFNRTLSTLKQLGLISNVKIDSLLQEMKPLNENPVLQDFLQIKTSPNMVERIKNLKDSRILQDFVKINNLGKGGYGSVIEARKKADDDRHYAVKCIPLASLAEVKEMKREVAFLSKFQHRYIVNFYSSWVESVTEDAAKEIKKTFDLVDDEEEETDDSGDTTTVSRSRSFNTTPRSSRNIWGKDDSDSSTSITGEIVEKFNELMNDQADFTSDSDDQHNDKFHTFIKSDNETYSNSENEEEEIPIEDASNSSNDEEANFVSSSPPNAEKQPIQMIFDHSVDKIEDEDTEEEEEEEEETIYMEEDLPDDFFEQGDDSDFCNGAIEEQEAPPLINLITDSPCSRSKSDSSGRILLPKGFPSLSDSKSKKTKKSKPEPKKQHFLFIQMELCSQSTLKDLMSDKSFFETAPKLEESKQWRICREILEALSYIHQSKVIHRDLKPQNIFIDDKNDVKLGDFGLSRLIEAKKSLKLGDVDELAKEATGTAQGSFPYTAPEITKGKKYDKKSDMYSFGIIFFEIWCYFPTQMERRKILFDLIDNKQFPPQMMTDDFKLQREIILNLLDEPEKRQTCEQLLEKMPLYDISNEDVTEMVRAITSNDLGQNPNLNRMMMMFFPKQKSDEFKTTFSQQIGLDLQKSERFAHAIDQIHELADAYGSQMIAPPIVENLTADFDDEVQVLTDSGSLLSLRTNLWRYLSKYAICCLKDNEKETEEKRVYQVSHVVKQIDKIFNEDIFVIYNVIFQNSKQETLYLLECIQYIADLIEKICPSKIEKGCILHSKIIVSNTWIARFKADNKWKQVVDYITTKNEEIIKSVPVISSMKTFKPEYSDMEDTVENTTLEFMAAIEAMKIVETVEFDLLDVAVIKGNDLNARLLIDDQEVCSVGDFCSKIISDLKKYEQNVQKEVNIVSMVTSMPNLVRISDQTEVTGKIMIVPAYGDIESSPEKWGEPSNFNWLKFYSEETKLASKLRDAGFVVAIADKNCISMSQMIERASSEGFDFFVVLEFKKKANCSWISKIILKNNEEFKAETREKIEKVIKEEWNDMTFKYFSLQR